MPTIKVKILEYLLAHPEGADDDELADALALTRRQQANSRCNQLAKEEIVERRKDKKFINLIRDAERAAKMIEAESTGLEKEMSWYWEGNVQSRVIDFLKSQGYFITRSANTSTHETGKDVEASQDGQVLWVTVKGYPEGTSKTHPSTQAGHWFKQALFDVVAWRGESSTADIVMALPDNENDRYRNLAKKVHWLESVAKFSYYWVHEDGSITT
jgi:hypothetical protein